MRFTPTELTGDELELQAQVRSFLAEELTPGTHEPGLGMQARHDKAFSKKMAEQGWVGMALPKEWGGSDKKAVDRFNHQQVRKRRATRTLPACDLSRRTWLLDRHE